MKRIFHSRIPPKLTSDQINYLTTQSYLSAEDVEDWYERFNHCYPRSYLSYKEFISYLNQLYAFNGNDHRLKKTINKRNFSFIRFK